MIYYYKSRFLVFFVVVFYIFFSFYSYAYAFGLDIYTPSFGKSNSVLAYNCDMNFIIHSSYTNKSEYEGFDIKFLAKFLPNYSTLIPKINTPIIKTNDSYMSFGTKISYNYHILSSYNTRTSFYISPIFDYKFYTHTIDDVLNRFSTGYLSAIFLGAKTTIILDDSLLFSLRYSFGNFFENNSVTLTNLGGEISLRTFFVPISLIYDFETLPDFSGSSASLHKIGINFDFY